VPPLSMELVFVQTLASGHRRQSSLGSSIQPVCAGTNLHWVPELYQT
jgi:hypothetical protein